METTWKTCEYVGGKYKNVSSRNKMRKGVDRIDLAQDGDKWRAVMNTVIGLPVP